MDNNDREVLRRLQLLIEFSAGMEEQCRQRLVAAEVRMRELLAGRERLEREMREEEERLAALRQKSKNRKTEE